MGKVSGWMIWIPRERLSAFRLQVYLDLSSVADCVPGASSGARWRGRAVIWSGNNTPSSDAPAAQQFRGSYTRPARPGSRLSPPAAHGTMWAQQQQPGAGSPEFTFRAPQPHRLAGVVAVRRSCALRTTLRGLPRNQDLRSSFRQRGFCESRFGLL